MQLKFTIENIKFKESTMWITIEGVNHKIDLNVVSAKLKNADDIQRNLYKISPSGYVIHWPLTDEDLSVEGLLKK
jgi:hypothetical protein